MKFWVCVVSQEHALRGINGGFVQVCHGKEAPLKRMKAGDFITFYCPTLTMGGADHYQRFLGVGKVISGDVYQFTMSENFIPFRMDISYLKNSAELSVAAKPLVDRLEFIQDKQHWGYIFRFGHIEIPEVDFKLIYHSMLG